MIRRPPRSTQSRSSAASDVYKRQGRRAPRLRPREPGPCGPPRRRAARRRRSSAPRPRPSTRAARRKARRWLWRPPRSALRPPPGQRAGTLDPRVQQLVLHGELADAAHGGVELALEGIALALLEPRVHAGERLVFPALEAVDLNAELAGERLERFSAQQPQRHLTLAREAPALPRSKWAQGHEVTLGLWVLLCHDGPFSRTLMLHKLVSKRSGAAAVRVLPEEPTFQKSAAKELFTGSDAALLLGLLEASVLQTYSVAWRLLPGGGNHARHERRGRSLHIGEHVAVRVQRDFDVRVAEPLLHNLGMDTAPQGVSSPAVAEVVHPDAWHIDACHCLLKELLHAIGVPRCSVFTCEDVAAVLPGWPPLKVLTRLARFPRSQNRHRVRVEVHGTAGAGLRHGLADLVAAGDPLPLKGYAPVREVDVGPPEAERFPPAQAGQRQHVPQRAETVLAGCLQESGQLFG